MFGLAYAAEVAEQVAPAIVAITPVADAWNQLLSTIIVGFLIPAVGYAAVLARAWVKSKTAKIKNDELRAAADFAMQRLDRIITNVVKEVAQTRPTGEPLTSEKAKLYFDKALTSIKQQVTDETMEVVKTVVKDPERYFATKIEAAVSEQKACTPDIPAMVRAEIARLRAAAVAKVPS